MKIRASSKIAIVFVVLVAAFWFGWKTYTERTVMTIHFPPIKPDKVSIVGIETGRGYRILVANQAAQLIQGGREDFDGNKNPDQLDETNKKRVPIREMLQAMQGDEKALGQFVAIMNDMQETDDWPTQRIEWKDEDLRKAISGDAVLKAKLEKDINVHLDGTPTNQVSLTALQNGIIIDTTVPCKVRVGDKVMDMRGPIQVPFRPQLVRAVEARLKDKSYDSQDLANYYADEGKMVLSGERRKENVAQSILTIIDPQRNAQLADAAQRVLESAKIVCTNAYITKATFRNYDNGGQNLNDMTIELSDEGRNRLWQYSHNKVGSQLLLIVNGVAIAAPRIQHELAQGELEITQMPDKILVQDAVDAINQKSGSKAE